MKKILKIGLILLLSAIVCATLFACNPDDPEEGNDPNEYNKTKYSVTFDSDGGTDFSSYNRASVDSGSYISKPANDPIKSGYTFRYWTTDRKNEFMFATTSVTSNITLYAYYEPSNYKHEYFLKARLVRKGAGDDLSYEIEEDYAGYANAKFENNVTSLSSTYNSTAGLECPVLAGDEFCFWYYIKDGKPKQLTEWKKESENSVNLLTRYTYTHGLKIYPMWKSNLPNITVKYADGSDRDHVYNSTNYSFADKLIKGDAPTVTKSGYAFDQWYYEVVNEDESVTRIPFVFTDLADDDNKATDMLAAAAVKNNFENATLTLYAGWIKQIAISSVTDYKNLYNKLHSSDTPEEEIEEILTAKIVIGSASSVYLGVEEFEPLFDADHVFKGSIDGGVYDGDGKLTGRTTVTGGTFKGVGEVSIFGHIAYALDHKGARVKGSGEIKNIIFDNPTIKIVKGDDDKFANTVLIGLVATKNGGTISNCDVTNTNSTTPKVVIAAEGSTVENDALKNGLGAVIFGGIAANNVGVIENCNVVLKNVSVVSESIVLGGVAGSNSGSSSVTSCNADIEITSLLCADDGDGANGVSFARAGGLVGNNGGSISACDATLTVKEATSKEELLLGGAAAFNTNNIRETKATAKFGAQSSPMIVGGGSQRACAGGLAGVNDGAIEDCMAIADIYVEALKDNAIVSVGGIAGSNFTAMTSSRNGSIRKSYATGSLYVTAAESVNGASVYAGGLAGRNSKSDINQNFAIVDITIVNAKGSNSVGYLFGSMEREASLSSGYYANDSVLTVNGLRYPNDSETQNVTVLTNGESVARSSFCNNSFIFGNGSKLLFGTDKWKIDTDGESLPVLVNVRAITQ